MPADARGFLPSGEGFLERQEAKLATGSPKPEALTGVPNRNLPECGEACGVTAPVFYQHLGQIDTGPPSVLHSLRSSLLYEELQASGYGVVSSANGTEPQPSQPSGSPHCPVTHSGPLITRLPHSGAPLPEVSARAGGWHRSTGAKNHPQHEAGLPGAQGWGRPAAGHGGKQRAGHQRPTPPATSGRCCH